MGARRLLDDIAQKIDAFELTFAVLVRKVVKHDTPVRTHTSDSIRALFAAHTRHYLGAECDSHLRPCPNLLYFRLFLLLSLKNRHRFPLDRSFSYAWFS